MTKKMGCYLQVQGNSEDLHNPSMTISIYDLVPKGVHQNRTKGVENKVDDTLKLVVFLCTFGDIC